MEYDAFISYSHAADGRLAPALQSGLQRMAKPWYRVRALRVFLDETGLSTNPHLWSSIVGALDAADWFVLLASPEAASSPWVERELAHWLAHKPADRVLPALTSGDWAWDVVARRLVGDAVPPQLADAFGDEPRHLDLRFARDETSLDLRNSTFRSAVADLAAPMHGIAKDDLEGEDIRQHRRARRLARGAVSALVVLLVVALVSTGFALKQRDRADRARDEATVQRDKAEHATDVALTGGLAAKSQALLRANQNDLALLLAVEANRFGARLGAGASQSEDARNTLLGALNAQPALSGILAGQRGALTSVVYSPDGKTIVSQSGSGDLRVWDAATRTPRARQPQAIGAGSYGGMALTDAGLLVTGTRIWDLRTNRPWPWQPPTPKPAGTVLGFEAAISEHGVLALSPISLQQSTSALDLWNVDTGRRVAPTIAVSGEIDALTFSPDGTRLGVDVISAGGSTVDLLVVDTTTGAVERRVVAHRAELASTAPTGTRFDRIGEPFFDSVVFSHDGRRVSSVVSRAADGVIATFDTASGARVGGSSPALSGTIVGISSDLREQVNQTNNEVAVVDTHTGARLADYPLDTSGGVTVAPVALDPTRPDLVYQAGAGSLAVLDWTQVGAAHFASTPSTRRISADSAISPGGRVVDLAAPLHQLGVGPGSNPPRPWRAAASATGSVAILTDDGIAVWNPESRRIERRLTGAPSGCTPSQGWNLAFAGDARHGRVVLECAGRLRSWDLGSSRSSPAWNEPWTISPGSGLDVPDSTISDDGSTFADLGAFNSRVVDGRTGKLRANGPIVLENQFLRVRLAPDARTLATVDYAGHVAVIDAATGALRQTLLSSAGNVGEFGTPGNPELAFSPDGKYLAVFDDAVGVEVWDLHTGASIARFDGRATTPFVPGGGTANAADPSSPARQVVVSFSARSDSLTLTDAQQFAGPASGSAEVRTVTWSLRPADWIAAACTIVGRDLTKREWNTYVGSAVPYHHTCTPLLATGPTP